KIVAAHERNAAHYAGKAASRFAFDPSDEAERLRRHERTCTRDMFRSLSALAKHNQAALLGDCKTLGSGLERYQPDAPARDSEPVESRNSDGEGCRPEAPTTVVLSAIDWSSRVDRLSDAAQSLPRHAGENHDNGAAAAGDGPEFQN